MCNFLSETPVLECVEQIFYKRGKVRLRVILLSSDFLELRAKTGNSPKEVLYCLKELKSHTLHWGLGTRMEAEFCQSNKDFPHVCQRNFLHQNPIKEQLKKCILNEAAR